MTNADKIRNMTDEELAKFLGYIVENGRTCKGCPARDCKTRYSCENTMYQWLKKETNQRYYS